MNDKIITSWELKDKLKESKPLKFYTGMTGLDKLIDGFEAGELIILSGTTKHGKTTVFQTLTSLFEKKAIYSLWFSYELPSRQLIQRFKDLPLFYLPVTLTDRILPYLAKKINEAKEAYGIKIVFIDHLHYLLDLGKIRNPSLEIGTVIRGLKTMAIKYDVVIFLACHTAKLARDAVPTVEDIRDSSFTAQESDCVMMLWRVKGKEAESRLKVEFHRRIGLIDKIIKLKFHDGELREIDDSH